MQYFKKIILIFILLLSGFIRVNSDEIVLNNGNKLVGKIKEDSDKEVKILTDNNILTTVQKSSIKEIKYDSVKSATPQPQTEVKKASPEEIAKSKQPPPDSIPTGFDAVLFGVVDDVMVLHLGSNWQAAKEKELLKVKEEIKTANGKTKISLRGRGELRLPVNSHLRLEEMTADGSQVTIRLIGGRVWNKVTPEGKQINYKVQTPDLVAGVRGTLFNVSINAQDGKSRVAVFEGKVETISIKDVTQKIELDTNKFTVVDNMGKISPPAEVSPDEIKEWTEWDEWALEVHNNVSSRFWVGGQVIDNMARLAAEDGKKYDAIMNEANATILWNREGEHLSQLGEAFLKYARDTGRFPTTEQGFSVLVNNPNVSGWKGPYIKEQLPVKDRAGTEIKYTLKTGKTGNAYGELISAGPNKIYSNGQTDDLKQIIPYYKLKDEKK